MGIDQTLQLGINYYSYAARLQLQLPCYPLDLSLINVLMQCVTINNTVMLDVTMYCIPVLSIIKWIKHFKAIIWYW